MFWKNWTAVEWGALGNWFLALATFFAALVSLKIAKNSNKPKVKVEVSIGMLTCSVAPYVSDTFIFVTGINEGVVPVTLQSSTLILPRKFLRRKKGSLLFTESSQALPKKLESSESTYYSIDPRIIAKKLKELGYHGTKRLTFVYGDSLGNKFFGSLKLNINSWLKN